MTQEERAHAIGLYTWGDVRAKIAEHIRAAVAEERRRVDEAPRP